MSQKYVSPDNLNENVIKTKQHVESVRSALDSAKQNVIQFTTLPVPDATWNGKVVQYTGTTTSSLTKGYFYSCEVVPDTDPTEYRWIRQDVMKPIDADGTTVAYDQVTGELSAIPATNSTKGIVQHGDGTEIGNDGQVNVVDRLVVTATLPTADDTLVGAVRLYIGASGTYELGGIYQCQETSTDVYEWVLISMADIDLSAYQKTFLGTTAEWNAKTTAQKIEFDEADLSDDLGGGMVVSNAITLGDHNPIDSDAVAQIVPSGASASNQLVTHQTPYESFTLNNNSGTQKWYKLGTYMSGNNTARLDFVSARVDGQMFESSIRISGNGTDNNYVSWVGESGCVISTIQIKVDTNRNTYVKMNSYSAVEVRVYGTFTLNITELDSEPSGEDIVLQKLVTESDTSGIKMKTFSYRYDQPTVAGTVYTVANAKTVMFGLTSSNRVEGITWKAIEGNSASLMIKPSYNSSGTLVFKPDAENTLSVSFTGVVFYT